MSPIRFVPFLLALLICVAVAPPAIGQAARGMVWTSPEGDARATQDLNEMADAGIEVIRTGLIEDRSLLSHADTLGLGIYMDLPVDRLPAARLADTLAYAQALVERVVALARSHASVRAIGLARNVDTSDSTACAFLRTLHQVVNRPSNPELATYYVTRFVDDDACIGSTDQVMLDLLDRDAPAEALRRWASNGRPAAIAGSIGRHVESDSTRGLRVRASPEQQARYLEQHLTQLLSDTLSGAPPAVFVYRWRDVRRTSLRAAYDLQRPDVDRFGIHSIDGSRRPAFDVVQGLYTGRQTVFAFEHGSAPAEPTPWTTMLGWAIVLLVAIFYALSPRFRHMVPRYFQAHFFFRDAVREGRDILFGASAVLLTALGAAAGIVWWVIMDALRATDAMALAVGWLPTATQSAVATVLGQPAVFVILAGGIYVIALLVWTVILSLLSRRRYPIAPAQVLMLVVWPRWPHLLIMLGAMVVSARPGEDLYLVLALAAGWMIFTASAIVRTLFDLVTVARIPYWVLVPALMLNPGMAWVALCVAMMVRYRPEVSFVWHAMIHS